MTDDVSAQLSYVNSGGIVRFASCTLLGAFGRSEGEVLDRHVHDIYALEDYRTLLPYMTEVLVGYPVRFKITFMHTGAPRYLSGHYFPDYDDRGMLRGYFSVLQDLTACATAELALVRSERALRLVLDNASLLVSHIDPNGVFTFCNVTHARWLRRTPKEVCGQVLERVFMPDMYALLASYMVCVQRGESVEFEITAPWYEKPYAVGPHNRTRRFHSQLVPDSAEAHDGRCGFYAFMQDATAAKRSGMELSRMARFDALTGLSNRCKLYERLHAALEHRQRLPVPLDVLYLDVNRFKHINDTYGHAAGDVMPVEVTHRLQRAVRRADTVARLAGNEFIILLDPIDAPNNTLHAAQKVVNAIHPSIHLSDGTVLHATTSVGVTCPGPEIYDLDAALREADRALYWAKSHGRNMAA